MGHRFGHRSGAAPCTFGQSIRAPFGRGRAKRGLTAGASGSRSRARTIRARRVGGGCGGGDRTSGGGAGSSRAFSATRVQCVMSGGRAKHAGARGTPGVKRAACAKYTNCAKHARCCSSRARCATCARLANGPRNGRRAVRAGAQGAERPNQTRGKRPPDDWPSHGQNTLAAPKTTATHSSRPGQIVARQWINASLPTPEAIHDNLTVRSTAGGALQVYTTHNAHAEPDRTRATRPRENLL